MEAKGETPSTECPPVECGQSDGETGTLNRKDGREMMSDRVRPVSADVH